MEKIQGCSDDDEVFSAAMQLASSSVLPFALKAAVELSLFEIMATSGLDFLSSKEIASRILTQNPHAPTMVERILRFLVSSSVLKYKVNDEDGSLLYGLKPVCKYFVGDKDGVSLAPYLLFLQDKVVINSWSAYLQFAEGERSRIEGSCLNLQAFYCISPKNVWLLRDGGLSLAGRINLFLSLRCHIKDAVVDGVIPFNKAHGMSAFEYPAKDHRFNNIFNQAMHSVTTITMKKIFEVYKGFEGLTQIIDVGGGSGATMAAVVSKYPNVRGINFDLHHVILDAPPCEGVEHVAGDMFESVPSGEAIFMKYILHDWRDDECLRILKNCWKALSGPGKVIVVESLLPQYPETTDIPNNVFRSDLQMLTMNPGGKERTEREYDALARRAGFTRTEVVCNVHSNSVIEFYKL